LVNEKVLLLENYYGPEDQEYPAGVFVAYYSNHRYHKALNNVTPADVYYGRGDQKTLARREKIKKETMQLCRKQNYFLRLAN
jgi:putative transposase